MFVPPRHVFLTPGYRPMEPVGEYVPDLLSHIWKLLPSVHKKFERGLVMAYLRGIIAYEWESRFSPEIYVKYFEHMDEREFIFSTAQVKNFDGEFKMWMPLRFVSHTSLYVVNRIDTRFRDGERETEITVVKV